MLTVLFLIRSDRDSVTRTIWRSQSTETRLIFQMLLERRRLSTAPRCAHRTPATHAAVLWTHLFITKTESDRNRQNIRQASRQCDLCSGAPPPSELYYSLINPNLWANSGKLGVNNKSKTNVLVCIITKISLFYQGTKRSTDTQTDIHTDIQTESMTENYKSPTKWSGD